MEKKIYRIKKNELLKEANNIYAFLQEGFVLKYSHFPLLKKEDFKKVNSYCHIGVQKGLIYHIGEYGGIYFNTPNTPKGFDYLIDFIKNYEHFILIDLRTYKEALR